MLRQYIMAIAVINLLIFCKSFSQEAIFYRESGASLDYFGMDCDVSKNCFIVGTDIDGTDEWFEIATVYTINDKGDTLSSTLMSDDYDNYTEYDQGFGYAVAMDTSHAIVGAYLDDFDGLYYAGSAYIFPRSEFGYFADPIKITANDASSYREFGKAVDISGDYAIIGSPYTITPGGGDIRSQELPANPSTETGINSSNSSLAGVGAAYIFKREGGTWTQEAMLQADDGQYLNSFGCSVAIQDSVAVIGAKMAIIGLVRKGAAYVFVKEDGVWTQKAKLFIDDDQPIFRFGQTVDISGDYVIVGANGDAEYTLKKGRAFIFKKPEQGWQENPDVEELFAPDINLADRYGQSVAIDQSTAAVCSPLDEIDPDHIGSISLFKRESDQWEFIEKLSCTHINSPNGFVNRDFGMYNGTLLLGASTETGEPPYNEPEAGRAYLFTYESDTTFNIFTGIGHWSDAMHWSLDRIPQADDWVLIRGHCTVDQAIPTGLAGLKVDTTHVPLPTAIAEMGLPYGVASLDLQRYPLPAIKSIKNKGIILTKNNTNAPFPYTTYWGGWIVFYAHSWLPLFKQFIPTGTYKNILLTGNKKVDAIDHVKVEQMVIKDGAHLKLDSGEIKVMETNSIP